MIFLYIDKPRKISKRNFIRNYNNMNAIKLKFSWQYELFHELTLLEKVRLLALNSLLFKSNILKEYKIEDRIRYNFYILQKKK